MAGHKEEVVISGVGGSFPECDNMDELKEMLFAKTNGVTIDSKRWNINELGAISGTGKLKTIDKFDATFFSAHPKLAENTDPLTRICLERSIEAIVDAGLSPSDLYGSNTAVFIGSAITEMYTMDGAQNSAFSMLGRSKTTQANRVSYILNLTGPSFTMDGGWICSSNGLEKAKEMIENGIVTSAIVGVTGLVLRPEIQFQFQGLNRLNRNDRTKSFSNDADGYNRSEACIVMLLQRASEAKRSYGTLLSVKSMQFGDHRGHITEHVGEHFRSLLLDAYRDADVDPATVDFVEAYGCGIKTDDSMELNVMEEVFCTDRRKTPLKVGSVKSNVGHCEVSGLFVSIVKAIIVLDGGYIPPNINYTEPNENVPALKTGKIQIVTEKTPFDGDVIGISSFGILNAFSHVVLRRNNKLKTNHADFADDGYVPRLILASGRNEENARETVKKIKGNGNDAEFVALTNAVFTKNINAHFYRCFSVFPDPDDSRIDDVWNVGLKRRPVWFVFSGMGSQWQGMGFCLMRLPVFADAIDECDTVLQPLGVDIKNVLTSQDPKLFDNILNSFVGIAAVQIGLVRVLKALDITPDGIVGHSVGELGCAYADGCFTAEEMILSAYAQGRAFLETKLVPGTMAAIGLGYDQIKDRLPHDIDVACRNSATSCTVSGPADIIDAFVTGLKSEGIFARAVNVAGIAFHSRYIQSAGPTLFKYLKRVIKEPRARSSRWVSSSLPESRWNTDLAKYSSPEYHANNLLSSVLFEDALKHVPSDAITVEIAPHGLLQAILNGALPATVTNIPLTKKIIDDPVRFLLTAVGKMYASGLNPSIQALYPPVRFPVARGTPAVHSLPLWDHNDQWTPTVARTALIRGFPGERTTSLLLNDNVHLIEYRVHGHHVVPFSFVLHDVWKMFIEMNAKLFPDEAVQFHDLRFKNDVKIHPTDPSECYLMIQRGSGLFEYNLDDEVILSGRIGFLRDADLDAMSDTSTLDETSDDFHGRVTRDEIYAMLDNNGYDLGENFKNIVNFNVYRKNIRGHVKWKNDWVYFLDGLMKFPILESLGTCNVEAPVSVRQINIVPTTFEMNAPKDVHVSYNMLTKEITCDGLKISEVQTGPLTLARLKSAVVRLEEYTFVPFDGPECKNVDEFVRDAMDIILEADRLDADGAAGRLVVCTPAHHGDPVSESCAALIERTVESQPSINSVTAGWDAVEDATDEDDERGRFVTVAGPEDRLRDTAVALAKKKCSYVVAWSRRETGHVDGWKIVTRRKLKDDGRYLTLMKKNAPADGHSVFVKPTKDNYESSIWTALNEHRSPGTTVFIISTSAPVENVETHVERTYRKYKSRRLRFLFVLDSNAPDFEADKPFYTDQLSKGLIVNIYKNGAWGSYKRTVLRDVKDDIGLVENPVLNNFATNRNTKLTVKYLGLNFKDSVVEHHTQNEFGPLEYSGHFRDDARVMGVAPFGRTSSRIEYDELLLWPVPSAWSLEDAATVPLPYAMSYYVLDVLCTVRRGQSVLVTSALHPTGRAAIAIALAAGCETYAIVGSDSHAGLVSDAFPTLPRSRILVNGNDAFDVPLMAMTASAGMDVVLNFADGDGFRAALRALARHGKFITFSKSDMRDRRTIGARAFVRDTSLIAVSWAALLDETDRNKRTVHKSFADGLNNGVVAPIRGTVLTAPHGIRPVLDAMRTASGRVLLSLDDTGRGSEDEFIRRDSYRCRDDRVYVIVGDKSDWLDIAEWLVPRGARRIVVAVERCLMSSTDCRRFDRLISRDVSVQIESDTHLNATDESLHWLTRSASSSDVLGSMFVANQLDDGKMDNLRHAFERHPNKTADTWFVCVSSKGERACDRLRSIGLRAVNVFWDGLSTRPKTIGMLLASLDTLLRTPGAVACSSFVCSEPSANESEWSRQIDDVIANFLPESVDELHRLDDATTDAAGFVEVPTRSPRLSQLKSAVPVFVIPGFRPNLVRTLYANMFYPTFEARLPADVGTVDELSERLVAELEAIADCGCVSLIGESWGGIVALKMAQMLEARGTMVTVSLLEGDPEFVAGWADGLLSDGKLNAVYASSVAGETAGAAPARPSQTANKTERALHTVRSRLRALLQSRPLPNKLRAKVLVFRYERTFDIHRANLDDHCVSPPVVYVVSKTDYKSMLADEQTIATIADNVVLLYPVGVELSLDDKYEHFYFDVQKFLKCIG